MTASSLRSSAPRRLLALGPGAGWHADQLRRAARLYGCRLEFAPYESLSVKIAAPRGQVVTCEAGPVSDFDAVLLRTMPSGSLEQVTYRLAILHRLEAAGVPVINSPGSLERAIDKYASLALIERLGYDVPPTAVVQSRREAMEAFRALGGDCVVKPIFGGEGRGVMRVREEPLAWTVFATLERIDAVIYLQQFIPPGGRDLRLLVIGEEVWGIRREAPTGWRTNVSQGGRSRAVTIDDGQRSRARHIATALGIEIGSVDLIDAEDGCPRVLEVNGVPGWKGAQAALGIELAEPMLGHIVRRLEKGPAAGLCGAGR